MFALIVLIIVVFAVCMICICTFSYMKYDSVLYKFLCYLLPPFILCVSAFIGILSVDPLVEEVLFLFVVMGVLIGWGLMMIFGAIILEFIFGVDSDISFTVSSWISFILIGLVLALIVWALKSSAW